MQHTQTVLLKAVNLAGSQVKLAGILDIHPTQLSAWLHQTDVNMPTKYGDMIEEWSEGRILKTDLFKELKEPSEEEKLQIFANKLQEFLDDITKNAPNITINVTVSSNDLDQNSNP